MLTIPLFRRKPNKLILSVGLVTAVLCLAVCVELYRVFIARSDSIDIPPTIEHPQKKVIDEALEHLSTQIIPGEN